MPVSVLDVQVGVSKWLESHSDLAGTNETYDALATLGVSNIAVSVVVDQGKISMAVKVETTLSDAQAMWLNHTNLIQLESVSAEEYKWLCSSSKTPGSKQFEDNMRVRFSGGTVLMAVEDRFSSAESLVFNASKGSILQVSVGLDRLLEPLLSATGKVVDAQEKGFSKAIMEGVLKSLQSSTKSIQDFPFVRLNIVELNASARKMSLVLNYPHAVSAGSTQSFFDDSENAWKNPDVSEKQRALLGLVDTPYFREMNLDGNQLQFICEWPASQDAVLGKIVVRALLGSVFSFDRISGFPLHPEETMDAPSIGNVEGFDAAQFEKDFRAALFFNYSWPTQTDFVVDYLDVPNADLLTATFTNVYLLGSNDVNVARHKNPGGFGFNSTKGDAIVSLLREKDGPPAKTASFTIELKVPVAVEKYTLTEKNPVMQSDDIGCCLLSMSNSVISLRSKGISLMDAKVYALNADGEYLKQGNASGSESNYSGEYKGIPATVEVVWPLRTESVAIHFKDIAVEKEDKLTMPRSPTNNIVTRYSMEPLKSYSDPDMDAIAASSMTYATNAGWKKNRYQLQFPKPSKVEIARIFMKSYLTGVNELVCRGERSGSASSGAHFYWDLKQTNILDSATAIFGEVEGSFWSGVGTYSANVSTNSVSLIPGVELPAVSREHNVVWVKTGSEGRVLDIHAFDESGRRLKKDAHRSAKNSAWGYFFWGMPSRAMVTYTSSKESVVVPFEIELKEGGLSAIPTVHKKIQDFEEVLELMKEIRKKARSRYGNLLSASYYVYSPRKEPLAAIPLEVAKSDPVGVAVFGYDLMPFKGYYFRQMLTDQDAKKETKKISHAWAGGEFETTSDNGLLLAIPIDTQNPSILFRWGNVYINYNDCSNLEQIPSKTSDLDAAGWIEIE